MNCLKLALLTALIVVAFAFQFSKTFGLKSHYGTPYLGGGGGFVGPMSGIGHGGFGTFGGGLGGGE